MSIQHNSPQSVFVHRVYLSAMYSGKKNITADDVAKKLKIKHRKANFAITEILNGIKDEYQESRKRDENDRGGGVGNDRPLRVGGRSVQGDVQRRAERGDERGVRRGFDVVNAATSLAESLGVKLNVVEDVNDITDPNNTLQLAKRGAKAWYDVDTDQFYFVAPNATSIQDAEESILHEVVAHKGLRDVDCLYSVSNILFPIISIKTTIFPPFF